MYRYIVRIRFSQCWLKHLKSDEIRTFIFFYEIASCIGRLLRTYMEAIIERTCLCSAIFCCNSARPLSSSA